MPILTHRSGSMMFWGCFNSRETQLLIVIRGIMKSVDYINILDENQQLSEQNLDKGMWFTFQQDNDHKQMSKSVTAWLQ